MTATEEKLGIEEIERKGDEIYERVIRSQVEPGKNGQVVAIDVTTEAWEIGSDEIAAANLLLVHHPKAIIWLMRIGYRSLAHFGQSRSMDIR